MRVAIGWTRPRSIHSPSRALAVFRVVAECFGGDAERVIRIAARFGAMVRMPSTLSLRIGPVLDKTVRFEVVAPDGGQAIRDGLLAVRS